MKSQNRAKKKQIQKAKALRHKQRKAELYGRDSQPRDSRTANAVDEETLQRAHEFLREWFTIRGRDFIFLMTVIIGGLGMSHKLSK
jgi:hypothetical protein